jgi:hypothetical protein
MLRWPLMVATIAAAITAEGWPTLAEPPANHPAPRDAASFALAERSAIAPRVIAPEHARERDDVE